MLYRSTLLAAALGTLAVSPAPAQTSTAPNPAATVPNPATAPRADLNTASPSAPPVVGLPVAASAATPATVTQTPAATEPKTAPQSSVSTGSAVVQTGGTRVHGTITDPDGAIIPGATVSLTPSKGSARSAKSGQDGTYTLVVSPGTYTVVVSMPGFASYSTTNLKLPAVASTTLDAKLRVGEATQVVNVEANSVQISIDPDSNASSTILTGKDLDALSDDPDELQSELTALAGPAAGPNGGQIYVDGFTGGELPPKSSIREIRVNQNPFSAQFDRLGFGRVEVFTKPGTDKFHGSFQVNGNPSFLNTSNPFAQSGLYVPPYHTLFMFGSVSGPITKWASFNLGGFHRGISDDAFTNTKIWGQPGSTTPCNPGDSSCSEVPVQFLTFQPNSRTEIQPRIDLALGDKNVLTTRFEYGHNSGTNQGIGLSTLPSAGYNSSGDNYEIQMSDTQTIGLHVINETRGAWERQTSQTTPFSNAPTVSVSGVFSYGGYSGQSSSSRSNHFELQNYTSIQTKKNFIRLGGRLRGNTSDVNTTSNTNGSFVYCGILPTDCGGTNHSYASGTPVQFRRTVINNPDIHYTFVDVGLYAESDWKALSNLTISYGIRYETQNYLNEHHDWAPRASFAYGVGKSKTPKTVIRGGIGLFYDRFDQGGIGNLVTQNGLNETVTTLQGSKIPAGCAPGNLAVCNGAPAAQTIYSVPTGANHISAPYILQEAIGGDQQLGRFGTVSVNYLHSTGAHALAVQNICAIQGVTCSSSAPYNYQYLTEGHFHENQLIINPKVQTTKWLSLFGYYSLISAYGNNSGASTFLSQPGNMNADLGPTSFDVRHRYFLAGSISLPRHIQLSPFMVGQSGSRFNITEGQDINGDSVFNDRPYLVPTGTAGAVTLPGCGSFLSRAGSATVPAGAQIVPSYYCTGPSLNTFNMRIAKTWGFGESRGGNTGQGSSSGSHRGQGGGGGHEHGGGGGGGPMMMMGGGGGGTGQRYNLTLGVQVQNLFNRTDVATPIGTLTSPYFGQSINLAGFPYTSNNARQRWSLQASFSF